MERGAERFAGMVVVPDVSDGLVRWLVGRAIDPDRTPRFQALPGPKPVLGMGRLGLAQWGFPACAALGTQGVERVAAAVRGCPRVFLAFDADDAGREATWPSLRLFPTDGPPSCACSRRPFSHPHSHHPGGPMPDSRRAPPAHGFP